jgi:hypothetical protein
MSGRISLGLVAALALLLTACEINIDYDLLIRSDGTSELETEIVYDEAASQMLGAPEAFLDELEQDTEGHLVGVTVIDSTADSSNVDEQRVSVLLAAQDPSALDALVHDNFFGSFTSQGDDVYELYLQAEDAAIDEDIGFDEGAIGASMVIRHDGERQSVSGGQEVDSQTVAWEPFGNEDLRMVVDLGAAGMVPAAAAAGGLWLWVLLGLLGLIVIAVIVILVIRRGGGDEATPAAGPLTGPSAGEVDGPQTPVVGDRAAWTSPPPTPSQPESWDAMGAEPPPTEPSDEPTPPEQDPWEHQQDTRPMRKPAPEPPKEPGEQDPGREDRPPPSG